MPPFTHLEFHRSGIGLVPEGRGAETAIYVLSGHPVFVFAEGDREARIDASSEQANARRL